MLCSSFSCCQVFGDLLPPPLNLDIISTCPLAWSPLRAFKIAAATVAVTCRPTTTARLARTTQNRVTNSRRLCPLRRSWQTRKLVGTMPFGRVERWETRLALLNPRFCGSRLFSFGSIVPITYTNSCSGQMMTRFWGLLGCFIHQGIKHQKY